MEKQLLKLQWLIAFAGIFFLGLATAYSQVPVPFSPRLENGNIQVKGDIIFVSNNILNRASEANPGEANTPYNGTQNNNALWMEYIDIDADPSTFSSSSASLALDDACSRVVYAGLYWASTYPNERSTDETQAFNGTPRIEDWNEIKFRLPGGSYIDIVADNDLDPAGEEDEIIFDGYDYTNINNSFKDSPIVCYRDVTNLVQSLATPNGEYTVANIRATKGERVGSSSAGWILVIIYENPNESGKYISTFDGYAGVQTGVTADYSVSGFRTLPAPFQVNARLGMGALEGDRGITGDNLRISSNLNFPTFTTVGNTLNPTDNFFNATITNNDTQVSTRNPYGTNTLGLDADLLGLNNPSNSVIGNDETGATMRLTSSGDGYGAFLSTFSVEIIEPEIQLVKTVQSYNDNDGDGVFQYSDITGGNVSLGEEIFYVISFHNVGNDNAVGTTIRDELPLNVTFDDLVNSMELPAGVTYTFTPRDPADLTSRDVIVFNIPDNLVVKNQPDPQVIRFSVNVVNSCFELRDACSNEIKNQAYVTYSGQDNTAVISDDPSFYGFDSCDYGLPGSSNFIANIDDCDFQREEVLCGSSITITAGDDFVGYQWYNNVVIDGSGNVTYTGDIMTGQTNQSLTVTELGTYRVVKTAPAPCLSFDEIINVVPFTNALTNPVVPLINNGTIRGEVEVCSANGENFPKIYLCGLNDNALIDTDINDAQSLVWERLNTGTCTDPGTVDDNCPNPSSTCTWTQVHTGNDYTANTAGEFRLRVVYQNSCQRIFYFDVYTNVLDPEITPSDIICNTPGSITVDSPSASAGYEFELVQIYDQDGDGVLDEVVVGAYQASNVFTGLVAGNYYVNARQTAIADGCVFPSEVEQIRARNPLPDVNEVQPYCQGELGSATVQLSDAEPPYTFVLADTDTGDVIQTVPAQDINFYEFTGLAAGNYTATINTADGCSRDVSFSIAPLVTDLWVNASVSQNVTCREGNIQMHSGGGQTPHSYAIYSYTNTLGVTTVVDPSSYAWQTSQIFDVLAGNEGTYQYIVVDQNNCTALSNEVTIIVVPPMTYSVDFYDETCFGANDGSVVITMTDPGGYTPAYSIDGGVTFQASSTFTGLAPGNYNVVVRGTRNSRVCDFPHPETAINPATQMGGSAALTQDLACSTPTNQMGIIEFTAPTGGSGSYEYSVGGAFQASTTFNNLTDGTYTPQIRDLNNPTCVITLPNIVIAPLNPPTDLTFVASAITCNDPATDVQVNVTGGTGTITYEMTAAPAGFTIPPPNTTGLFTALDPGPYTFRVTDENNCMYTESHTISDVTPIVVSGVLVSNVTCFNDTDGAATYTVSGFASQYSYTINGGTPIINQTSTSIPLTGLSVGPHEVIVTDQTTGCTDNATVTIANPPTPLDLPAPTITGITCGASGTNPGAASVTATGGWGSYSYNLEDGVGNPLQGPQGNGTFNNLVAGDYVIIVTDANGCEEQEAFTLADPISPVLTLTPDANCYTAGNPIDVTASIGAGTGTSPFNFELNTGATNTTGIFTDLTPGTYTVTVTDANGCTDNETIIINQQVTVSATADDFSACDIDTQITITPGGGDGSYTFAVMNNGVAPTPGDFSVTNPVTITAIGDYDVWVQDGTGCQAMFDLSIGQDPPIVVGPPALTHVLCNGGSTGTIDYTGQVSGGQSPYTYSINGGTTFQVSPVFNNLAAGTYNVVIRDSENCEETATVTINEPAGITATASVTQEYTCAQEAEITINSISGGSGQYEFSINGSTWEPAGGVALAPYTFTNTFTNGTYSIDVRDVAAPTCIFTIPDIVIAPLPAEPVLSQSVAYNCDGSGDITILPSDPNYAYQLENTVGGILTAYQASNIFPDVAVGSYIVRVNYGAGTPSLGTSCTTTIAVTVNAGNEFRAAVTGSTNVVCNGDNNGTITFEVENFGAGGFEYSLDNFATAALGSSLTSPVTIGSLAPNNYTITVRDVDNPIAGCTVTLTRTITEPTPVVAGGNVTVVATCDDDATIVATASGGLPGYTYELQDTGGTPIVGFDFATQGSNDTFAPIPDGDYLIAVQDNNGCIDTFPITVAAANPIAFTTTPTDCYAGDNNGQIQVDVTNGNGNYTFSINGLAGPYVAPNVDADTHIFSGLTPGTYDIVVRDGLGCDNDPAVQVTINGELTASAVLNKDIDCSVSPDGQITISQNGGLAAFTYAVSDDGGLTYTPIGSNVFTSSTPGTYQFQVTDALNCTAETAPITLTPADLPQFTVTPTDALCNGDSTGILDVNINTTIGIAPYTTEVFVDTGGGVTGASFGSQTTNLPAGNYVIRVTDAKDCFFDVLETIGEPSIINPGTSNTNLQCTATGTELGTITVDASGGTGANTYLYEVFNADFSVSLSYDTTISPNPNSTTFSNLNFGDYTVRVVDANGCENISTVTITTGPDVLITTTGASACLPGTGQMSVRADASNGTLGTGSFFFAVYPAPPFAGGPDAFWFAEDAPGSNTHLFTTLTPGVTYTFIVHDNDTNCEYYQEATVPVSADSGMVPVIDATTNVTCTGAADGTADFTVSGHLGTDVSYEVFVTNTNVTTGISDFVSGPVGGPVSGTATGIPPGEYYILFTEVDGPNAGCVIGSDPFVIQQSPALLDVNATSTNDNACSDVGTITAIAQNGTPPYEFQLELASAVGPTIATWVGGNTTGFFNNVADGNYIVYVKDANDCIQETTPITVILEPAPVIALSIVDNCATEGNFQILVQRTPAAPTDSPAPYTISVDGSAAQTVTFDGLNQFTITGLNSGAHTVQVFDANGCPSGVQNITIASPMEVDTDLITLLDCEASPNDQAEIEITASGGSGTYNYEITGPGIDEGSSITALPSNPYTYSGATFDGPYTITIYDMGSPNTCPLVRTVEVPVKLEPTVTITNPTNVSCEGADDGTITASVIDNGTGPYTFSIIAVADNANAIVTPIAPTSFTATTATFTGLDGDAILPATGVTYTVRVTTANSCTDSETQLITEPDAMDVPLAAVTVTDFVCTAGNNMNNALIEVDPALITGGSGSYVRYEFIPPGGSTDVTQDGADPDYIVTDAAGGIYTINVYDSNGCVGTTTATIDPFTEISNPIVTVGPESIWCTDGEEITVSVTFNPAAPTTPPNMEYTVTGIDVVYNETVLNTANSASFTRALGTDLPIGTYSIIVTNLDTGCFVTTSHTVQDPNTFDIDVNVVSDAVCFGDNGQVNFTLIGGYAGAITYQVFDQATNTPQTAVLPFGTPGPTTPDLNLPAGDYYVRIVQTSAPECTNTRDFSIAGPSSALSASTNVTDITCALNDGIIEIINPVGGWGGYTYFVGFATNPAPTFPGSYQASPVFSGLGAETYQVWIADQNGCEQQILPNITLSNPTPLSANLEVSQANCNGNDGEVTVTGLAGGIGPDFTYQLQTGAGVNIGGLQNTGVFSGLGAGTYQVYIEDQFNCFVTTNTVTLLSPINAVAGVTADLTCDRNDGEITVTVNGGSGVFEYEITAPAAEAATNATGVFGGLNTDGIYSITITDQGTLVPGPACTITVEATINPPIDPILNPIIPEDVSCRGGNDGVVNITLTDATNDDPPYTYTITTPAAGYTGPLVSTNGIFNELVAGTYNFTVESSLSCTVSSSFVIGEPPALSATAAVTQEFACDTTNGAATGEITVTVDAVDTGTAPYVYSLNGINFFNNGGVFEIADTGIDQTFNSIVVRDANGCTFPVLPVTITALPRMMLATTLVDRITCDPGNTGETITVDVTGLPLPTNLVFEVLGEGIIQPNNSTIVLPDVGTYTIRVTDVNTGCFDTVEYTVAPYDTIGVTASNPTPVTCVSDMDGTMQINVTGYTGAYDYVVFDEAGVAVPGLNGSEDTATGTFTIIDLPAGNFTVRVTATATPFCETVSNSITIPGPSLPLDMTLELMSPITCVGGDGAIRAIATGGWNTSYSYTITYPVSGTTATNSTGIFSNLGEEGTYTVDVTDAGGCTEQRTIDVVVPVPIVINSVTPNALVCEGDTDGTITVDVDPTTGRGPAFFQYILINEDTGAISDSQSSNIFTNLAAGNYSVQVIDGWDCDATAGPVEITEPTEVIASLVQLSPLTCENDAEIQVTATGGTGPYNYSTSPTGPFTAANTFTVGVGQYQYYAEDAAGCISEVSNMITIEAITPLQVVIDDSAANLACFSDTDAVIRATATGGLGNNMYELLDAPTSVTPLQGPQASGIFSGLGIGTYYVRVVSVDCEDVSEAIIITEPTPLVEDLFEFTNPTCTGEGDGTITYVVSGGTGIIKYAITPDLDQFDENSTFENLSPGTYTVIAQDENGCYITRDFIIVDPVQLTVTPGTIEQELCAGDLTGSIEALIEGGTAPYTAAITYPGDTTDPLVFEPVTDNGDPTIPSPHTFSGLAGGITYTIFIEDANGCTTNVDITLDPSFDLTAGITVEYGCTDNFSTNTVTVSVVDPTAAAEDLIYVLDGVGAGQLENVFTNVPPGDHFIEILAPNGCVNNDPDQVAFNILAIEDLGIEIFESNLNEFTYNGTGGVPPYEYYVDGEFQGTDNIYRINRTDTYTVRVVDSNGCEFTDTIFIEFYDIEVPPVFTPDNDGINDEWEIINDEGFPNMVTKVYDRYGRWLATMRPGQTWDGNYDGKPLPSGDYWYVIKINGENDPREFIGHFTLYR